MTDTECEKCKKTIEELEHEIEYHEKTYNRRLPARYRRVP